MQTNHTKDVDQLEDIIRQFKMLTQPLGQIEGMMEQLGDLALQAEKEQNVELLQFIFNKILPELDMINEVYEQITNADTGTKLRWVRNRIEWQERSLNTFRDGCLVHIAADDTENAGDYILVRSLRKLLEGKNPDIKWYSAYVRRPIDEEYIKMVNRCEGVVIGGGGFFLRDTNQNEISGWQWPCPVEDLKKIQSPIYVMGVGYNRFRGQEEFAGCFRENINTLVEKSAFFGLRNHGSIRAIRSYLREDLQERVVYHPCATTVLSKMYQLPKREGKEPFIVLNCAFDRVPMRYGNKTDEVMRAVARVAKTLSVNYRIKCYTHCSMDERIYLYLDEIGVDYEKVLFARAMSEEEYLTYFTEPELVLAMRGHGQMIPFGCKTPVVSMISHDKLQWFLDDIEHPEWGVEVLDEQFEEKLLEKSQYMLAHREEICQQIEAAQEKLWDIMQENLKKIVI